MQDRFRQRIALIFCLFLAFGAGIGVALAEEEAFVSPTRNPDAPKYDEEKPWDLQAEQLVADAFVLMEADSGDVLMERNMDKLMYPASITKIMTALLALQFTEDMSEQVEITASALDLPDEDISLVPFKVNEVVSMQDAIYGMMLRSGNEAAKAIAEHFAGSEPAFVDMMNSAAAMIGMNNTHFANSHGLHHPDHYTTAYDMALLTREALQYDAFRKIVGTQEYALAGNKLNPSRKIVNSNLLLDPSSTHYHYPFAIGVKTGFHSLAGYTLVGAAEKDGVMLIAVILYSGKYSRWPDARWLLEYGFTKYKSITPQQIYRQDPIELQVTGFARTDPDLGKLRLDIQAVDPSRILRITGPVETVDLIAANYRTYMNISLTREARAPIQKGDVMGILTFIPANDEPPAQYELVAARDIAARDDAPPTLEEIEQRVLEDPWPLPPFSWDWVMPPLLISLMALWALRQAWRLLRRRRKETRRIPKPKKRYFR